MQRLPKPAETPQEFRLKEYKVPDYFIKDTHLRIDLTKQPVEVTSILTVHANPECPERPKDLVLDGQNLKLKAIMLDTNRLIENKDYVVTDKSLTVFNVPKSFLLLTEVEVADSQDLFGLYKTEGVYLVKAETEGLRKVIFCKDRPDVLSTYTTTIIGDLEQYPTLLSNGNVQPYNKTTAIWNDTVPKPSYLFSLVAGKFEKITDRFETKSGQFVDLEFYVKAEAVDKCHFAKAMLKQAMKWDEVTYGLECDLITHRVVGIDKYPAGASEPTGLNLFNTEYLLANAAMKDDVGFLHVADVISHEYFHYWTGNQVTIRDWFNLTLKEGLTTFRAQEFLEDTFGADLMRIQTVKDLPHSSMDAKAARQDSYVAVRNLYTASAYSKGAEIFRMMQTVIGKEKFRTGIAQFLKENRGKAMTVEALLESLQKTTRVNLSQFLLWFTQAGTPVVDVKDEYHPETQTYTLKVRQSHPNKDFKPVPVPIKMALLDEKGNEMTPALKGSLAREFTLVADAEYQEFQFKSVRSKPVPSLLRDYSACVKLKYDYDSKQLLHLMDCDPCIYNRWIAMQQYFICLFKECYAGKCKTIPKEFLSPLRKLMRDKAIHPWVVADMLTLPTEKEFAEQMQNPDLDVIHQTREGLMREMAKELQVDLEKRYADLTQEISDKDSKESFIDFGFDIHAAGRRRLRNQCLKYLVQVDPQNGVKEAMAQFCKSVKSNMTNTMAALEILANADSAEREQALEMFYSQWATDSNAINNWFKVQASVYSSQTIARVKALMEHKAFDITNPNKVYSLFRPFINNPSGFHAASGEGYKLLADVILKLDQLNPQTAANLARNFVDWENCEPKRQYFMRRELHRIAVQANSSNVQEVLKTAVQKSKAKEAEDFYSVGVQGVRFWGSKDELEEVLPGREQRKGSNPAIG